MDRKRAQELLPIIQAFAEGKKIQVHGDTSWIDAAEPKFDMDYDYRIKPEELKVVQQAKDLLPFIQALADGKIVQELYPDKEGNDVWKPIAECQNNAAWHLLNMSQSKDRLRIKPEEEKTQFPGGESLKHKVDTVIAPKDKTIKHYHHSDITSNPPVTHLSGDLPDLKEQVDQIGRDTSSSPKYKGFVSERMNEDKVVFEGKDYKIIDKDNILGGTFYCFKCKEKDAEIKRLKALYGGIKYYEGDEDKFERVLEWARLHTTHDPSKVLPHKDIMRMWWKRKDSAVWERVLWYMTGCYIFHSDDMTDIIHISKEQLLKDWEYAEVPPEGV